MRKGKYCFVGFFFLYVCVIEYGNSVLKKQIFSSESKNDNHMYFEIIIKILKDINSAKTTCVKKLIILKAL